MSLQPYLEVINTKPQFSTQQKKFPTIIVCHLANKDACRIFHYLKISHVTKPNILKSILHKHRKLITRFIIHKNKSPIKLTIHNIYQKNCKAKITLQTEKNIIIRKLQNNILMNFFFTEKWKKL